MNDTLRIPLHLIDIPEDRLRSVDMARAGEMVQSMLDVGAITPIEVLPADENGRYRLNAGAHRVTAARIAELPDIVATIFSGSPEECRLREIDENLYRHELTAGDQAAFLAERKVIYERINGPIARGGSRKAGHSAKLAEWSFFAETSRKFHLPRRTIERALSRWTAISPAIWKRLRGTELAKKGSELDALRRLSPEMQDKVISLLLDEGRGKSVTGALRLLAADAGTTRPAPTGFEKFMKVWGSLNTEERDRVREFVKQHAPRAKGSK